MPATDWAGIPGSRSPNGDSVGVGGSLLVAGEVDVDVAGAAGVDVAGALMFMPDIESVVCDVGFVAVDEHATKMLTVATAAANP